MEQNQISVFNGKSVELIETSDRLAITAEQLGKALDYSDPRKSINNLFNRYKDEFVEGEDYCVTNLVTEAGQRESIVFFHEGAILIAMFSAQPKAKDFRRWAKQALGAIMKSRHVAEMESIISADSERLRDTILFLCHQRDRAFHEMERLRLDSLLARTRYMNQTDMARAMELMEKIQSGSLPMTIRELARGFRTTEDRINLMYFHHRRLADNTFFETQRRADDVVSQLTGTVKEVQDVNQI